MRGEKCLMRKRPRARLDSARIRPSSLLKWLNSLYRPAWPEESEREPVPPHSRQSVGASPSGKAVDFDSTMRRFESSRPSQAVRRSAKLPGKGENGPEMPGFRAFDFVSRLPNRQSQGANRRKSPATPANIPILQRLSAETGFDHDCRPRPAVEFAVISDPGWALGPCAHFDD
jgi:hypothetical protein